MRFERRALAATAVPWLAMLVLFVVAAPAGGSLLAIVAAVPHQASTLGLYVDREARPILRSDPARYFLLPALAIIGGVAVAGLAPLPVIRVAVVPVLLWGLHHITKQNVGMLAFACKSRGVPGPTGTERRLVRVAGWAGAAGAMPVLMAPIGSFPDGLSRAVGLAVLAGCGVWVYAQRLDPWRTVALELAVVFWLPLFVWPAAGVAAYAGAHAVQYLFMMGQLRGGRDRAGSRGVVVALVGFTLLVGYPMWFASNVDLTSSARWLYGLAAGFAAFHFLVDAGVWKLSQPTQRAYMKERFAFL